MADPKRYIPLTSTSGSGSIVQEDNVLAADREDTNPPFEGTDPQPLGSVGSRTRKLTFGVAVLISTCLLGLSARYLYGVGCVPDESILGLPDFESKVQIDVGTNQSQGEAWSHDVVASWLTMANEVRDKGFESESRQNAILAKALKGLENISEEDSRGFVQNVLKNSADVTREHRDDLKKFAESFARQSNLTAGFNRSGVWGTTPGQKAAAASCTFDILSILSYLALAGSDINDAVRTCKGVKMKEFYQGTHVHDKVCGFNVLTAVGNVAGSSAIISAAAANCADTLVLNQHAICSASMIGLIGTVAQFAGSVSVANAACQPWKSWYGRIDPDLRASEIGSNKVTRERGETYVADLNVFKFSRGKLHIGLGSSPDEQETGGVSDNLNGFPEPTARRLLFGGGKKSIMAQCIIDAAQVSWGLAYFALHVNSLANTASGQSCPAKNLFGGTSPKDVWWITTSSLCAVDIFAMINYLLQVASFIALGFIHCTDTLNLKALCTVGIDGIIASISGMGLAAAGVHIACDVFMKSPYSDLLKVGHALDKWTKGGISHWYGNGMGGTNFKPLAPFGRRLRQQSNDSGTSERERPSPEMREAMDTLYKHYGAVQSGIEKLKKDFSTPDEVYASIGLNISDRNAPWRKYTARTASADDLVRLIQKRPEDATKRGLFEQPTCKR